MAATGVDDPEFGTRFKAEIGGLRASAASARVSRVFSPHRSLLTPTMGSWDDRKTGCNNRTFSVSHRERCGAAPATTRS